MDSGGNVWVGTESGQILLSLVDDILDISKIATGKTELHPWTIRLAPFLDNIVAIIRARASEKRIDLVYEADPDLPEYIAADGKRLGQVLLNLLGNAVKFTDAGRTAFRVKSDPDAPPGAAKLCFEVEDTGPGIPPDRMKAIFLPFEQAGDLDRRTEGSGLGLAISRQLVRLMGGDIEVESEPDAGSLFRFGAVFQLGTGPAAPERTPVGTRVGYQGERRRLLVIDDKNANRLLLRDMLAPLDFEVLLAHHGAEGVRLAAREAPHLVLMDLVMPGMSGFEAARKIRDTHGLAKIPIVAVSAGFTDMTPEGAAEKGFDAYLSKPVDADALCGRLQDLLGLEWVYKENGANGGIGPDISKAAAASAARTDPTEASASGGPKAENLSPAQRRHAVYLIRQRLLPLWETLVDSYYIDDIKTFAAEMKAVAAASGAAALAAYAEQLDTAAARHQVDEIDDLLAGFDAIHSEIEEAADDAGTESFSGRRR